MIAYRLLRFIEFCFGVVLYGVIGFNDCDLFCCNRLIELLFIIMPPIDFGM